MAAGADEVRGGVGAREAYVQWLPYGNLVKSQVRGTYISAVDFLQAVKGYVNLLEHYPSFMLSRLSADIVKESEPMVGYNLSQLLVFEGQERVLDQISEQLKKIKIMRNRAVLQIFVACDNFENSLRARDATPLIKFQAYKDFFTLSEPIYSSLSSADPVQQSQRQVILSTIKDVINEVAVQDVVFEGFTFTDDERTPVQALRNYLDQQADSSTLMASVLSNFPILNQRILDTLSGRILQSEKGLSSIYSDLQQFASPVHGEDRRSEAEKAVYGKMLKEYAQLYLSKNATLNPALIIQYLQRRVGEDTLESRIRMAHPEMDKAVVDAFRQNYFSRYLQYVLEQINAVAIGDARFSVIKRYFDGSLGLDFLRKEFPVLAGADNFKQVVLGVTAASPNGIVPKMDDTMVDAFRQGYFSKYTEYVCDKLDVTDTKYVHVLGELNPAIIAKGLSNVFRQYLDGELSQSFMNYHFPSLSESARADFKNKIFKEGDSTGVVPVKYNEQIVAVARQAERRLTGSFRFERSLVDYYLGFSASSTLSIATQICNTLSAPFVGLYKLFMGSKPQMPLARAVPSVPSVPADATPGAAFTATPLAGVIVGVGGIRRGAVASDDAPKHDGR